MGPLGKQPEVRFRHAHLTGLFNERPANSESQLTALLIHDLASVRYRAALALVKIRYGKRTEALHFCEAGNID
jgi:hypothetical protein